MSLQAARSGRQPKPTRSPVFTKSLLGAEARSIRRSRRQHGKNQTGQKETLPHVPGAATGSTSRDSLGLTRVRKKGSHWEEEGIRPVRPLKTSFPSRAAYRKNSSAKLKAPRKRRRRSARPAQRASGRQRPPPLRQHPQPEAERCAACREAPLAPPPARHRFRLCRHPLGLPLCPSGVSRWRPAAAYLASARDVLTRPSPASPLSSSNRGKEGGSSDACGSLLHS